MDEGFTDVDGRFRLAGITREMTTIDPRLKIYHTCAHDNESMQVCNHTVDEWSNDRVQECTRKWRLTIPQSYVSFGQTPARTFNLGSVNLEVQFDNDDFDCS